jgi:hypothetical protein
MNRKTDNVKKVIEYCTEREKILLNNESVRKYNVYYEKMMKYANYVAEENRQVELLPYLNHESISVKYDIATILYRFYPEKCHQVLLDISKMTINDGIPKRLAMICVAAYDFLKYGI